MAIRDKRVYFFGIPETPDASVKIYMDIEGLPDEEFVYLIGMTVVGNGYETHHAFWADTPDQEAEMFRQFLTEVEKHPDARVYCYGSYERAFLKRMRKSADRKGPVDRVLSTLVNVLSVVYTHAYFPCHSNGLKDVAGCLGFSWSDPTASGVQSIVWRKRWEAGNADQWKQTLLTYNRRAYAKPPREQREGNWASHRTQRPDGDLDADLHPAADRSDWGRSTLHPPPGHPMEGARCERCHAGHLVPRTVRRFRPWVVGCGHALVGAAGLALVIAAGVLVARYSYSRLPDDLRDEMRHVDMPAEIQAAFIDNTQVGSKEYDGLTPAQKEVFKKCLHYRSQNSPDLRSILLGLTAFFLGVFSAIAYW